MRKRVAREKVLVRHTSSGMEAVELGAAPGAHGIVAALAAKLL